MSVINIKNTPTSQKPPAATTNAKVTPANKVSTGTKKDETKTVTGDVIKFNTSGVQVKAVKPDGSVVITIKAHVDPVIAIKSGANSVGVTFSKHEDAAPKKAQDPESVLASILDSSREAKEAASKRENAVFKMSSMDITSKVSNSIVASVKSASEEDARKLFGSKSEIVVKRVSDSIKDDGQSSGPEITLSKKNFDDKLTDRSSLPVKNAGMNVPVLDTPMSTSEMFTKRADATPKQLAVDMLLKDGISSARAGRMFSPVQEIGDVVAGTLPGARKGNDFKQTDKMSPADGRENYLVGSLLGEKNVDLSSAADLSERRSSREESNVTSVTKKSIELIEIEKEITLSPEDVRKAGDSFNVILDVKNGDSSPMQQTGCRFNLAERIASHLAERPPIKETSNGSSVLPENSVSGKGVDPKDVANAATGRGDDGHPPDAEVWVSTYSPFKPLENLWIKKTEIPIDNEEIINKLKVSSPSSVVRLVRRGHSPPSPGFAEIVVQPHTRHVATTSHMFGKAVAETDNRFVALSTFLRSGGVTVYVAGFQSAYTISVVRKDHTIKERDFKIIDVKQPHTFVDETVPSVVFVDTKVNEDHIYEYRVKIFTKTGREIFAIGSSLIKFRRLVDNVAKTEVSQPILTSNISGDLDVTFDVDVDISDTNISLLSDIMKSRGLDAVFTTDIEENRERLKNLTSFFVERFDMTSGVVERFNLFKGGNFSDKDNRNFGNVSPLQLNRDYRYVISVVARDADTIIPSALRSRIDRKTGKTYFVRPAKVYHPDTLRNGTIHSEFTITKADVEEEMLAGFIGSQTHVDISTKTQKPRITGGNTIRNSKGSIDLRWRIEGDASAIDHFVVIGQKTGMRSIVGRTHALSSNSSFFLNDSVLSVTPGDITYSVIPVFSDLVQGDEFLIGTAKTSNEGR